MGSTASGTSATFRARPYEAKVEEVRTFRDIFVRQINTLHAKLGALFDSSQSPESPDTGTNLHPISDPQRPPHAHFTSPYPLSPPLPLSLCVLFSAALQQSVMMDATSLKATTGGIVEALEQALEMMAKREEVREGRAEVWGGGVEAPVLTRAFSVTFAGVAEETGALQ